MRERGEEGLGQGMIEEIVDQEGRIQEIEREEDIVHHHQMTGAIRGIGREEIGGEVHLHLRLLQLIGNTVTNRGEKIAEEIIPVRDLDLHHLRILLENRKGLIVTREEEIEDHLLDPLPKVQKRLFYVKKIIVMIRKLSASH
jgi:hypothetical protein